MSFRISFARHALPQLILAAISPVLLVVIIRRIDTPLPFVAFGFALVAYNFLRTVGLVCAFFRANPRAVYEFTQARVVQRLNGAVVKELTLDEGVKIYRRAGIFQKEIIFSQIEIPKGARLRVWADCPEAIVVPYHPDWMKKLSGYFERAVRI